jgi:VanZ family protein
MNKKLLLTVICVLYIIILFIGATVIKPTDISKAPGFDKVFHLTGFIILTILLTLTLNYYKLHHSYIFAIFIALLIGIIIEIVQKGIPEREFNHLDLVADLGGAIIAVISIWIYFKRKNIMKRF